MPVHPVRARRAGLEWKNGWTLAEHAGELSPDGTQRLLRTADRDVEGVRHGLRGYVLVDVGLDDPAVLITPERDVGVTTCTDPRPRPGVT